MYDSVTIRVDYPEAENVRKRLVSPSEQPEGETLKTRYSGSVNNLRIWPTKRGVTVTGSLPKFLYDENLTLLTRATTAQAFNQLEEALGVSLDHAEVGAFEFGANIPLSAPVKFFVDLFEELSRFERSPSAQHGGVYFSNSLVQLAFYDKCREMIVRRGRFDREAVPPHLLRYEIRFRRRLPTQFSRDRITTATLVDPDFYRESVYRWLRAYQSIRKRRELVINPDVPITGQRDFVEYYACAGIMNMGGASAANRIIDEAYQRGHFKKHTRDRLRARVVELSTLPKFTVDGDHVFELNRLIEERARIALDE